VWKHQGKTTMKIISDFELIDHGIGHPKYFQGCGVAFTSFENVVTGIGDNPAAAIDDCLEQIAQDGFETKGMEARIMEQKGWEALPTTPDVQTIYGNIEDIYYHVSIRWNEEKGDNQ
jgi:hypothetical protein